MNDISGQSLRERNDVFVDRRIYTDPAVLEEEREKIFRKVWVYLCHESQIAKPGDFRCLSVVDEPIIVARAEDGGVHAFFNSCRHRGSIVELESEGNRDRFACPYHGFEYDCTGALVHVPKQRDFGDWFKKADFGLVPLPRIETFNGMVFGSLNPDVAPFADYIGKEIAELLPYCSSHETGPLEVVSTLKYDVDGNWKLLVDNTMDGYHVAFVHGLMMSHHAEQDIRDQEEIPEGQEPDVAFTANHHASVSWMPAAPVTERLWNRYMLIFPNLTAHYNAGLDIFGLRQIEPVTAQTMQVTQVFLAPQGMSDKDKRERAARFSMLWGPGGQFGADDARQVAWTQRGLRARIAAPVISPRGLDKPVEGNFEDEHPLRGFRAGWARYMEG